MSYKEYFEKNKNLYLFSRDSYDCSFSHESYDKKKVNEKFDTDIIL